MGVAIGVGQVAANLSTGTQDITDSNLGVTAKFAMPFGTRGLVNGTPEDGAGMYWGIADGALQASWAAEEEHNVDTSDAHQDSDNGSIVRIMDGTADFVLDAEADHDSFISSGERINWGDAPSAAFLLNALLGGGTDLSVKIVQKALGTGTSPLDVTDVGFESDDVIVFLYGDTNNPQVGMGLVHNDRAGTVTQRYLAGRTRTGRGTTENQSVTYDDACLALMGNTAVTAKLVMSDFGSSGFTVTPSASFSSATAVFLCLRYGSSPVIASKVYTFDTPTGTGEATDGGPDFTPQAVLYIMGLNEAVNTYDTGSQSYSVGIAVITPNAQFCSVFTSEDGSGFSDTQSLTDDQAFNQPLHDGSAGLAATYASTQSTGFRYNWTAVTGAAKKWIALAWEAETSGVTVTPTAASAAGAVVAPTVIQGSLTITPVIAAVVGVVVDPSAVQGSLSLTPVVAEAKAAAVDPTVVQGAISVTPVTCAAAAVVTAPAVVQSSLSVTPVVSEAKAAVVDPTAVQGSLSITPDIAAAATSVVDPTVVQGSISVTPVIAAAVAAVVDPTVDTGGGTSVTPVAAEAAGVVVDPAVVLGSISVTPVAAIVVAAVVDPTVVLGSITVTPVAAAVVGLVVDPTAVQSSLALTPVVSEAKGAVVDPTIVLGSVSVTPVAAEAVASVSNPSVILGSISITPEVSLAVAVVVDPTVTIGNAVEPTVFGIVFGPDYAGAVEGMGGAGWAYGPQFSGTVTQRKA